MRATEAEGYVARQRGRWVGGYYPHDCALVPLMLRSRARRMVAASMARSRRGEGMKHEVELMIKSAEAQLSFAESKHL